MAKRPSRKAKPAPTRPRLLDAGLGPLVYLRRSWPWTLFLLALCAVLTLLTQVGGVVLWLAMPILAAAAGRLRRWSRIAAALEAVTLFLLVYGLVSLLVVPPLAALGGRVPLPCFGDTLGARSAVYCALNRHYVRRDLRTLVEGMADAVARTHPGAQVRTLDAGFPFLDGFPLLPHRGHRNGTDVDLALFYRDRAGRPAPSPSPLGYRIFFQPREGGVIPDEAVASDVLRWLGQEADVEAARRTDHIHVRIKRSSRPSSG